MPDSNELLKELHRLYEQREEESGKNTGNPARVDVDSFLDQEAADAPEDVRTKFRKQRALLERFNQITAPPLPPKTPSVEDVREFCGGRYQVLKVHDAGGLGVVYVAHDNELGRQVAVKGIRPELASSGDHRGRFHREANLTGGLEHPGIVPVYGLGADDRGQPYYAMKFIDGEQLTEAIKRYHRQRRSPEPPTAETASDESLVDLGDLLDVLVAACETIAFAHSRGVIHRDIKPDNILIGGYGEVLVVDWGLAKTDADKDEGNGSSGIVSGRPDNGLFETANGSAGGTPLFMSPEQARAAKLPSDGRDDQVGPASDIYSLGATLYQILTGRYCVAGRSTPAVVEEILAGRIAPIRPSNPEVPRPLEAICRKALALEPQARYASAKDLAADIRRFRKDQPVTAWPDPWHESLRRWIKQHRTFVTSLAAAVVVAVVGLTIAWQRELGNNQRLAELNSELGTSNTRLAAQNIELQRPRYATQLELVQKLRDENDLIAGNRVLDSTLENLRGIEWRYWKDACRRPEPVPGSSGCSQVVLATDGSLLATLTHRTLTPRVDVRVIDTRTGQTRWSHTVATTQINDLRFNSDQTRLTLTYVPGPDEFPIQSAFEMLAPGQEEDQKSVAQPAEPMTQVWNSESGQSVSLTEAAAPDKETEPSSYHVRDLTGSLGVEYRRAGRSFEQLYEIEFLPARDALPKESVWPPGPQASVTISSRSPVVAAALSSDASMIATAHKNSSIHVWSVPHGRPLFRCTSGLTKVLDVEFLPDDGGLVWTGEDYQQESQQASSLQNLKGTAGASKWLFPRGAQLQPVADRQGWPSAEDLLQARRSADGRSVAFLLSSGIVSVWDTHKLTRRWEQSLPGLARAVRDQASPFAASLGLNPEAWYRKSEMERNYQVAINSSGTQLAIASVSPADGVDVQSKPQVEVIELESGKSEVFAGYCGPIAFDASDGKLAAGLPGTGGVALLDLERERLAGTLGAQTTPFPTASALEPAHPRHVAFSPDGAWLAMVIRAPSGEQIQVWHAEPSGTCEHVIENPAWDRYGGIEDLFFSPDGGSLLVTFHLRSMAHILETQNWTVSSVIGTDAYLRGAIAFSPDGTRIAKAGKRGEVEIWDAQTGDLYWTFIDRAAPTDAATFVLFSPDGQTLLVGSSSGVRWWSPAQR